MSHKANGQVLEKSVTVRLPAACMPNHAHIDLKTLGILLFMHACTFRRWNPVLSP